MPRKSISRKKAPADDAPHEDEVEKDPSAQQQTKDGDRHDNEPVVSFIAKAQVLRIPKCKARQAARNVHMWQVVCVR